MEENENNTDKEERDIDWIVWKYVGIPFVLITLAYFGVKRSGIKTLMNSARDLSEIMKSSNKKRAALRTEIGRVEKAALVFKE